MIFVKKFSLNCSISVYISNKSIQTIEWPMVWKLIRITIQVLDLPNILDIFQINDYLTVMFMFR